MPNQNSPTRKSIHDATLKRIGPRFLNRGFLPHQLETPVLPPSHPLIEAATKPLAANAEQYLAAKSLLEENFDPSHPEVPAALARLAEVEAAKHTAFWKWLLPVSALLCLLALGIAVTPKVRYILAMNNYFGSSFLEPPTPKLPAGLSPEERLLLGDPAKTRLQQKEALLRSGPERPDLYSDYVTVYLSEFDRLPDDYFETIARIDPDNAYFLYLGAAAISKESLEKVTVPLAERKNNQSMRVVVTDEAEMAKAMALFRKARELPRFDSYLTPMLSARIRLLEQDDFLERFNAIAYVAGMSTSSIRLRNLADAVTASAESISKNGDTKAFSELVKDNDHFLRLWGESPGALLVDELVFWVCANASTKSLLSAATELGVENQYAELAERKKRVDAREAWRKGKRSDGTDEIITLRGGTLHSLVLPMVGRQIQKTIPVTEDEIRPGRLLDHEIASQIFLAISSLVLLLASVAVHLFRFRAPFHARKLGDRLSLMLGKRDWAWVLLGGVVLPFVFIILINRHTPLGGREQGLRGMGFMFPMIHFVLLTIALFATPILMLRWRLSRWLGTFGLSERKPRTGWILLALGLAWVVGIYPFVWKFGFDEIQQFLVVAIPALWLLALLITAARALFGKSKLRVSRAATANHLIPAYALGIILLASLYPMLVVSERKLTAQDTLLKLDPELPGMTPYEYKVTVQLREEINEMLGYPPAE